MGEDKEGERGQSRHDDNGFPPIFPTETQGDGKIRDNNVKTGAGQGKGSFKRKVSCRQCGFLMDLARDDHSGGSEDGQGSHRISFSTETVTNADGSTYTVTNGDARHSKGSGCPFCGSKNGSKIKLDGSSAGPVPRIGF